MSVLVLFVTGAVGAAPALTDPWADSVEAYAPGLEPAPGYAEPRSALGEPTRFTGKLSGFPGAVTPFNPAFDPDEVVSIGRGGSLVLRFDEPVRNERANPWGVDLLVFGNAGFIDTAFPRGVVGGLFGTGRADLELSADGVRWFLAPGVSIDGMFPTLGYADLASPYAGAPGSVETDFTRPVRPGFDPRGKRFARISRAYAGSGGGTGVDIGLVGLDEVSFVRISVPFEAGVATEIDAVSDVSPIPAPASLFVLAAAALRPRRSGR